MNCFECAKVNDTVAASGVCRHCGVGLCLDHLVEARSYTVGGTHYACAHDLPATRPLRGVPARAQLVDELPLAQATVSQHPKVLENAGLVVGEIERPRTCNCASRERLAELHGLVGSTLAEAVEVDTTGCE